MTRPLMQHGVGQLEQLFAASKTDPKVLKQLENELRYRQVPRALALLAEVQSTLYSSPSSLNDLARPAAGPIAAVPPTSDGALRSQPVQPGLWSTPVTQGGSQPKPAEMAPILDNLAPDASVLKQRNATQAEVPTEREPSQESPLVTLADAFKLFKATASSTWESIEQTRRQAVQASSPTRLANLAESQRKAAREEARRLNAAYAVLSLSRAASQRGS